MKIFRKCLNHRQYKTQKEKNKLYKLRLIKIKTNYTSDNS